MKHLSIIAALAVFTIGASAQNVSTVVYLTNLPPQLQAEFEAVYLLHQAACTTNMNSPAYLSQYTTATNIVAASTNELGVVTPASTNIVTLNARMVRSKFMDALFETWRGRQNVKEIVAEGLAAKRREIGDARNQKTGVE